MEILKTVADTIIDKRKVTGDHSLGKGTMGLATFLFRYAKYTADEYYYDQAFELLDKVHDVVADQNRPKLDALALELGLTFSHLNALDLIDIDLDEIMDKIDTQFHDKCLYTASKELDSYLIPAGFYFLARYKDARQEGKRTRIAEAIIGIADELKNLYAGWRSNFKEAADQNAYNISYHKRMLANIAILISNVCKANISTALITPFLIELKQDLEDLATCQDLAVPANEQQREFTTSLYIIYALQCIAETVPLKINSFVSYQHNRSVYDEVCTVNTNDLLQAIFLLQLLNAKENDNPFETELSLLVSKMEKSIFAGNPGGLFCPKGIPDLGMNGGLAGAGTVLIAGSINESNLPIDLLLMFGKY